MDRRIDRLARILLGMPAAPEAPPAPVIPKEKPVPRNPPKQVPQEDPFSPAWPEGMPFPEPKAKKRRFLQKFAAYEDEVIPSIQKFWGGLTQDKSHAFGSHPFMTMYGDALSRESYGYTSDRTREKQVPDDPRQVHQIFQAILQKEAAYQKELEQAAKQITAQIWGVPINKLKASLSKKKTIEPQTEPPEDGSTESEGEQISSDQVKKLVNKRITVNTLSQGVAVHGMFTAHHMVAEVLNKIDPALLKLYDQFSSGSHKQYWMMDFAKMIQQMGPAPGQIGLNQIQKDQQGQPIVVAWSICFVILVQELFKGVMELLSLHGLNKLDRNTYQQVVKQADNPEYEPWQIQIGPALWRRMLQLIPKGTNLSKLVMNLNKLGSDSLHRFLAQAMDQPEEAKKVLGEFINNYGGTEKT